MKVLFICRANAGRSQMAEAIFNSLTNKHKATSAGSNVKDEGMTGSPPDERVITALEEVGLDISACKRKQVTPKMVEYVDKVIVLMQKDEARTCLPSYISNSKKTEYWTVRDMRGSIDPEFHRGVRNEIEKRVKLLIKKLDKLNE